MRLNIESPVLVLNLKDSGFVLDVLVLYAIPIINRITTPKSPNLLPTNVVRVLLRYSHRPRPGFEPGQW